MSHAHRSTQDNALAEPEALSPGAELQSDDPPTSDASKKKSTLLPMLGGMIGVLIFIGFFSWKMAAPYLTRHQEDSIQPLPVNTQPPQAAQTPEPPFQPSPQQPAQVFQMTVDGAAAGQQPIDQVPAESSQTAAAPIASAAPMPGALTQAYGRLNTLEQSLAALEQKLTALQQTVAKLAATATTRPAMARRPVARQPATKAASVKNRTFAPLRWQGAPTQTVHQYGKGRCADQRSGAKVLKKSGIKRKSSAPALRTVADNHAKTAASAGLHLKAVLDGRAWFQNKQGESITVTPGEAIRGVGIVQSIDAERGWVVFSNGIVIR